jgi:hypothetical protein
MKLSRWGWRVAPAWTFFLGLLIGGIPGGVGDPHNLVPIALYLATLVVLIPLEVLSRRVEARDTSHREVG